MSDCQDFCSDDATCKSVAHNPTTKSCSLSTADTSTVTLSSPCGGDEYSMPVKSKLLREDELSKLNLKHFELFFHTKLRKKIKT